METPQAPQHTPSPGQGLNRTMQYGNLIQMKKITMEKFV